MKLKSFVKRILCKLKKLTSKENAVARRANELCTLWARPREEMTPGAVMAMLKREDEEWKARVFPEIIDIIIPIYNGLGHLKRLIPSIIANTSQPHRFIFIDDCSPDPEALKYIESAMAGRKDALILRNERNVGFTGSVLKAAMHVKSSVFVLLNSDTVVPENWLERLVAPFAKDKMIGSTTPFSNSAVYFSYPNFGGDHKIKDEKEYLSPDMLFRRVKDKGSDSNEFITGTGFCMGIRKRCWDKFGGFDVAAFGKGYGEECDWCMRIMTAGYKNVIVPNLFVYHNHGGSFDRKEKENLGKAHTKILKERWGGYMDIISKYDKADPWAPYRLAVSNMTVHPPIDALFVGIHSEVGGSCIFRKRQIRKLQTEGKNVVSILYNYETPTLWYLSFPQDDGPGAVRLNGWGEVEQWIEYLRPKEIFVNDLAFCQDYTYPLYYLAGFRRIGRIDEKLKYFKAVLPNAPVESVFTVDSPNFSAILLKFGTYMRINRSHITIKLETNDGRLVAQREVWCRNIADNSDVELGFEPIAESTGRTYKVIVKTEDGDDDDSVAVYLDNPDEEGHKAELHLVKYFAADFRPSPKMTFFFHDFFSCCPSLYLQDPEAKFCDFLCCQNCIKANPCSIFKCDDISVWRHTWGTFLSRCTTIRFFSDNSLKLASRVYCFDKGKVVVRPHDPVERFASVYSHPPKNAPLSLAFVGAWTREKGCFQIMRLARILSERMPEARIHVHGVRYEEIPPYSNIIYHGRYKVEELPELLTKNGVYAVLLSSIVPETFSFVAQECIEMGVPVIAFPIGASGDRIAAYDKGYIARDFTGDALYEQVLLLQKKKQNHGYV